MILHDFVTECFCVFLWEWVLILWVLLVDDIQFKHWIHLLELFLTWSIFLGRLEDATWNVSYHFHQAKILANCFESVRHLNPPNFGYLESSIGSPMQSFAYSLLTLQLLMQWIACIRIWRRDLRLLRCVGPSLLSKVCDNACSWFS